MAEWPARRASGGRRVKPGVAARLRTAELVVRVVDEGAHSNVLLDRADTLPDELRSPVTRLTMDTLRWVPFADGLLRSASSRPLAELDPFVRSVLRVAVTELVTGGAPHAVVDSAVEAVREGGSPHAAGFVNAVLRRVAGRAAVPDPAAVGAATTPAWIQSRLAAAWGEREAEAFLAATLAPAGIGVRWRPGAEHVVGEPVAGIAGATVVADRDAVAAAGDAAIVMDPSSTAVAAAVGAKPGMDVLDLAAAPGNKTSALWDAMQGEGRLVAADRHERRLRGAARRLARLGVTAHWVVGDGTEPPFQEGSFDRVLVDAPCSGLGTLRRRPEIKLRLDPAAPAALGRSQRALLEAARRLVRPGGRLVYAVCTVFPEETTEVAAMFGGRPPSDLPGREWGGGLLLGPHLTGTDGMFITVFDV